MYIVEVRRDGDGLAEPMAQIRTWLDHERIQPNVFPVIPDRWRDNLSRGVRLGERGGSICASFCRTGRVALRAA